MEERTQYDPKHPARKEWFRRHPWIFVAAPLVIAFFIALCGEVVMHLWNWLLPAIFGWRQITFWQALGLLVLCRILFGSWRGGNHRKSRRRWEPTEPMTPEERERFRQTLRSPCAGFGSEATETRGSA